MDHFVNDDGSIRTYSLDEYNIDNILPGRNLLFLYKLTGEEKYRKAAATLREQLKTHPRTSEGGFWHKKIYPSQMWLDGLYMGEPFYAEYAATFHEDAAFDDIAKQFILMERHARDDKTGLLYHGWDESRKQRWANPDDRTLAKLLGARDGLVRDGARRHARLLSAETSATRRADRDPESSRAGSRQVSGSALRTLVSGVG